MNLYVNNTNIRDYKNKKVIVEDFLVLVVVVKTQEILGD